jgi:hypothetical protein
MAKVIVAVYDTSDQVTNVVDDLVSTGIPRERIRVDEHKPRVEVVVVADAAQPEIAEILERHQPADLMH